MKAYLGIDLGGTNTKVGIVTPLGKLLESGSVPTRVDQGPQEWAARVVELIRSWKTAYDAIGIGSPGPMDYKNGRFYKTPNLPTWEGFSIKKAIQESLAKPVFVENDANCGALAEYLFGEYKGRAHTVVLTLGTGVGSGVICNGSLVRGFKGLAAEIGHIVIDRTLPIARQHDDGMLEAFVGGRRTVERFLYEDGQRHSMEEIFELARQGNAESIKFVKTWIRDLGTGVANTMLVFNPEIVILAGGVTASWDMIRDELWETVRAIVPPSFAEDVTIDVSRIGEYFGVLGAAALAVMESGEKWQTSKDLRS